MHDYGYSSNKAYIKNFLLRVTPFVNGSFERDSNLNFDDQFNTSDDISMDVTIPLKYISTATVLILKISLMIEKL